MYIVIITGGIGSGKSLAVEHLKTRGALTLSLDEISHVLLEDNDEMRAKVIDAFGSEILDENGLIVPSKLAHRAFADDAQTALLNSLTHPYIMDMVLHVVNQAETSCIPLSDAPVMVMEVPLLNEAMEFENIADEIIAITAPREVRVQRLLERGLSLEDINNRIAQQITDEERAVLADTVFQNDGTPGKLTGDLDMWWIMHSAAGWRNAAS